MAPYHQATQRNYLARVNEYPKAKAAKIAKQFGKEYWDGDRYHGYGGYHYDGRWKPLAQQLIDHYQLSPSSRVLDVGCGKGFLLHEIQTLLQNDVHGIDISQYAIDHAKETVKPTLCHGNATHLPYPNHSFDLVISINTLHNLKIHDLFSGLREIVRVMKDHAYICVESYRNEDEKVNLMYWQLTCEAFYTPEEWEWIFHQCHYRGDYSFIYFE